MYVMKIAASTHESGTGAKVYAYEGHYEIGDSAIEWQAEVSHQDGMRSLSGSIPLTSPPSPSWPERRCAMRSCNVSTT